MHTQTMEGLIGARTNMNLMNVPMRVYREARQKGDVSTMERAMGYVMDIGDKAQEYQKKADEGMEKDAKEAKEKEKKASEKMVEERRKERDELRERLERSKAKKHGTEMNEKVSERAGEASGQEENVAVTAKDSVVQAGLGKKIDVSI